ncbi:hypothetical protein CCACVL1_09196 [Corchorus capsularis]|uniref:Uncharacterized protein n=1 Tax=Corchorus capsularis TaxID=210143 RepID=A0A1R3IXB8_COCAP|nr:hypothetical protein CCACVL1_09196 [Corchorus capsularis]
MARKPKGSTAAAAELSFYRELA